MTELRDELTKQGKFTIPEYLENTKNHSADDPVFLLQGKDEYEIYVIDDISLIKKLNAKVKELEGMSENKITKYLLHIVNPEKYPTNE